MIIHLTCTYCNHQWERYIPKKSEMGYLNCIRCGDKQLKIKDSEKSKTDYYAGAPEFPQSRDTKELVDYMLIGSID
jgi:transcription elongation factor Elf1